MQQQIMRRAFDIFSGGGSYGSELENWLSAERELVWKPQIELQEKDNSLELRAAVAGMDPRDIRVEVTSDQILIKAESQAERRDEKGQIYVTEFQRGSLFRAIHLPKRIETNAVRADLKNGLLTITAPIADEARGRRIDVRVA
ncbi:MAG TPA: Hsp20/alpha crystallin family protein [Terriglobia bacterium]|nr:Hsp20/alpha crystallin family protein [Terriglobia bacterium]